MRNVIHQNVWNHNLGGELGEVISLDFFSAATETFEGMVFSWCN